MKRTTLSRRSTSAPAIAAAEPQSTGHPLVADPDREHPEPRISLVAAGRYCAAAAYDEALRMPNPAARLDRMLATLDEVLPSMAAVITTTDAAAFAENLRDATAGPLQAFAAIEHARAEIAADYSYLLDYLVENLRAGGDPHAIRKAAEDTPQRLRDQAEAARQADAMTDQQDQA
ncbi:hypothetical protein [Streptomyces sp. NBC_00151]|uniref:hypothetical protein n=1 Tax=Streptomyces sp. NBC_00151 TaxID=2975669 RepID=UPI002DDC4BE0|nr:hypothetical protein [Streptomyces sp. NBC_00151]WRZ41866.1 hypothetical protein OG915_29805 [Streptomyces sp. NBC_00151]